MASQLLLANAAGEPHRLRLGPATSAAGSLVAEVMYALGAVPPREKCLSGELVLASGDWLITAADLRDLEPLLLQRGLRLWDGHNLRALEQSSALVRSLIQPVEIAWLIHPQEVSGPLRGALGAALAGADRPD